MDMKDRKNYLGASDTPAVMGVSPWKTRFQLWEEKLGLVENNFSNFATERGKALEEPARQKYMLVTGKVVEPKMVQHPNFAYMRANYDGINADNTHAVEIKCPGQVDHKLAAEGKIPEKYYPQLQKQMLVAHLPQVDYFSYVSDDDYHLVTVARDEAYILKIYKEEHTFWVDHVEALVPPELTDKDYVENESVAWAITSAKYQRVKDKIKELEKEEKEVKAMLLDLSKGKPTCGSGIKLQKVTRKGNIDTKAIEKDLNISLEKYRKSPTTSWRVING